MADDNVIGAENPDENKRKDGKGADDAGLSNLPPLSDFDSGGGMNADDELPPLGNFETRSSGMGGLPPLGEIPIETPIKPKLDVSAFQRVLVAGFLAGGTNDVDGNLETTRLLRARVSDALGADPLARKW